MPVHLKDVARDRIDHERNALIDLSHRIHGKPELAFEEEHAAGWRDQPGFCIRVLPRRRALCE